ncbi:hypothetical protein B0H11DRAFT_174175 [Mycena galericulata]|nr:hypothetical protein B0H11DRAFT_174175 [Mycena galericulata]
MSTTQYSSNTGGGNQSQYDPYDSPRTPRRTPMACQFCRARKLKCGTHFFLIERADHLIARLSWQTGCARSAITATAVGIPAPTSPCLRRPPDEAKPGGE